MPKVWSGYKIRHFLCQACGAVRIKLKLVYAQMKAERHFAMVLNKLLWGHFMKKGSK